MKGLHGQCHSLLQRQPQHRLTQFGLFEVSRQAQLHGKIQILFDARPNQWCDCEGIIYMVQ